MMALSVILTVMLSALLLVITTGNGMVLVLYCFERCLRAAPANVFICMLCVTDLLVGVTLIGGIVLLLKPSLQDNTVLCVFLYALINLFVSLSLHFQAAIAWDRWLAISHPLQYTSMVTMKWVLSISALTWLICVGMFFILPVLWRNDPDFCHFWLVLKEEFLLYVATPIYGTLACIIMYCYIRIFNIARKLTHSCPGGRVGPDLDPAAVAVTANQRRPSQADNDMKAAKTLGTVLCLNVITWVPCLIVLIILALDSSPQPSDNLLKASTVTMFLPCLHSAWNPWIYSLRLPAFRTAGKRFRRRYFGAVAPTRGGEVSVVTVSQGHN